MSIADSLVDALDEHYGFVPLPEYSYRVAVPSKYLASHLWAELKDQIGPVLEVKAWMRKLTKKLMSKGHPLEWTSPMGWPMRIADRQPTTQRVITISMAPRSHRISRTRRLNHRSARHRPTKASAPT